MEPDRWQRIKTILDAAADRSAGDRKVVLDEACGEDEDLRQDVEAFLDLDDEVEEFIEEPLWSLNPDTDSEDGDESGTWGVGRRVGPYRIERAIGRGGMGTVFLAVREDDYEQKVAVKVLSWGMSSEEVLGRFYNERQILANLEHPSIARLLDGGTTDDSLPYLVMEYVEGERIDRYCETRSLPVRDRLDLFRQVCAAVQYAHQNLIVHRDLKASNILVNDDGKVRLLDFGIAKILQPHLAFQKVATLPGHAPMTPAYASPEQVLNDPITTACDVYALGVLLYRLLTGLPPYSLEGTSYPEMVHVICYQEPERPSTVVRFDLTAAQENEATEAAGKPHPATQTMSAARLRVLGRKIAGDLDAIVLKAMRKEPEHRYSSAAELSDDIQHHLVGLPVMARKGNWVYFTSKFLRRNKLALAAILLILGFAVTATILWREAVEERAVAEAERIRAESQQARAFAVRSFLVDLFESAEPNQSRGDELTALDLLDQGKNNIALDDTLQAADRAEMLGLLGTVYNSLGRYDEAKTLKVKGLEVLEKAGLEASADYATHLANLASFYYSVRQYEKAEKSYREVVVIRQRLGQEGPSLVTTLSNLASALIQRDELEEAEKIYLEVLEIRERSSGPESESVAKSSHSLGSLYFRQNRFEDAERLLLRALHIYESVDPEQTRVADVCNSLGRMNQAREDYGRSRTFFERALEIRSRRLGEDHLDVAYSKENLASVLLAQGEVKTAGPLIEQALVTLRKILPEDNSKIAAVESLLGAYLTTLGRYSEAESFVVGAYSKLRAQDDQRLIQESWMRVVDLYEAWGKPEEIEKLRVL